LPGEQRSQSHVSGSNQVRMQVWVLNAKRMKALREQHARGHLHQLEFAADRYFKDYTGGSSTPFFLSVPDPAMDATFVSHEPRMTCVEYLRICIRWAGFPGMATWKESPADDLAYVT
jgi:hypothetical protein